MGESVEHLTKRASGSSHTQASILQPLKLPEIEKTVSSTFDQNITCLLCERVYQYPAGKDPFLKHLLEDHRFVIADVHMIADFPAYIRYWKSKFSREAVASFCTTMRADVRHGDSEDSEVTPSREYFSLLSDVIPEDKELRKKIQMDRLEQVLAIQETERQDTTFKRSCLFCRQEFSQPANLFDHMAFDHNFSVGQPDNLVFVRKLLDLLKSKLEKLICLYCEKVFKSREVLKEHMRKKGHRKIDPHNRDYDEFYLVNYLEFGKNWEDISREKVDFDLPPTGFDSDREEDGDWSDWKGDLGGAVCLFCPVTYSAKEDLLNHMLEVHGFDFQKFKRENDLNFYQQVKLVNYIRRCVHLKTCIGCCEVFPSNDEMLKHLSWSNHYSPAESDWNQPQFYFPTYENDNLLYVLEDDDCEDNSPGELKRFVLSGSNGASVPIVPEEVPVNPQESILCKEDVRKSLVGSRRGHTAVHRGNATNHRQQRPK